MCTSNYYKLNCLNVALKTQFKESNFNMNNSVYLICKLEFWYKETHF